MNRMLSDSYREICSQDDTTNAILGMLYAMSLDMAEGASHAEQRLAMTTLGFSL